MKVELKDNILFKSVGQKIFQSDILNRNPKKINSRIAVFSKGHKVTSLYLLIEGTISFINYNFINRRKADKNSRILQAGDFFGHEEIATGKRRSSSAITMTDCEIYEITVHELDFLIAQDRQILNNLNWEELKIDAEQNIKQTKQNKLNSEFRTRLNFENENQIKNNAGISERELPRDSLSKEKAELNDKEIEIKQIMDELAQQEFELRTAGEKDQIHLKTDIQMKKLRKRKKNYWSKFKQKEKFNLQ